MNKIFTSSNYVIVENNSNNPPYSRGGCTYNEIDDVFTISQNFRRTTTIPFSEVPTYFNEAGDTAYTVETLRDFLRENTGK